jgi:hypothetical protein
MATINGIPTIDIHVGGGVAFHEIGDYKISPMIHTAGWMIIIATMLLYYFTGNIG